MTNRSFHQKGSPPQPAQLLIKFDQHARNQDDQILELFKEDEPLSPSQIWEKLDRKWLLTSCRRSLSNLAYRGCLIKTNQSRLGPYGKPESLWVLAP